MNREESALQKTAESSERAGHLQAAFDAWRALASIAGNRPDYFCKLGSVAQDLEWWEDAERAFRDALMVAYKAKARPGSAGSPDLVYKTTSMAKTLLGSLFLERSDGDRLANARKAKEWLEQAVAVAPNRGSLSFLGSALARLGEKEAAKSTFRKVIELDETYAEAYQNLGVLQSSDGQAIEAEGLLRRAAQLDTDSYRAHRALGIFLQELGHYAEAEAELKRTLELNPTDSVAYLSLSMMGVRVSSPIGGEEGFRPDRRKD